MTARLGDGDGDGAARRAGAAPSRDCQMAPLGFAIMVVFSNRRLGPAAELLVSPTVAESMLRATAAAARPEAAARWEQELVRWLEGRATPRDSATRESSRGRPPDATLDVAEIAWTPENFDRQRRFLLRAIELAAETSEHARALRRWAQLIEAHPKDSVQFGRLWPATPGT